MARFAYSRENILNIEFTKFHIPNDGQDVNGKLVYNPKKGNQNYYYKLIVLPYKLKVLLDFKIDTLKSDVAVSL